MPRLEFFSVGIAISSPFTQPHYRLNEEESARIIIRHPSRLSATRAVHALRRIYSASIRQQASGIGDHLRSLHTDPFSHSGDEATSNHQRIGWPHLYLLHAKRRAKCAGKCRWRISARCLCLASYRMRGPSSIIEDAHRRRAWPCRHRQIPTLPKYIYCGHFAAKPY